MSTNVNNLVAMFEKKKTEVPKPIGKRGGLKDPAPAKPKEEPKPAPKQEEKKVSEPKEEKKVEEAPKQGKDVKGLASMFEKKATLPPAKIEKIEKKVEPKPAPAQIEKKEEPKP